MTGRMHRRTFCSAAIGAGIASVPSSAMLSMLKAMAVAPGDLQAVTKDGTDLIIERSAVQELSDSLSGPLLFPGDERYSAARHVWNGMVDKHPAMIALCENAEDVSNLVSFAAERDMLLSVKGGGHSFSGKCVAENGLMIDLAPMNKVSVDPDSRQANVQGGALLGQLDGASLSHDLVTTTGVVSHTGVGGFSLGGGFGRTDRVTGLAVDNILAARVITADGQQRQASPDENPDLYWAIRGGGGNFGVVTDLVFQLHPFNPSIYGGSLYYPLPQLRTVLEYWAEVNDLLPDGASVEPQILTLPDGTQLVELQLYYTGDHAEGEKVFAPFTEVGKPDKIDLGLKQYSEVQTMWDDLLAHGKLNYIKSGLLPELSQGAIDAIVESYQGEYLPGTWFQHLGGASARVDPQATAYPHRNVHSNYGISAFWLNPAESAVRIAKIREIYAAVSPFMEGYYANLNEEGNNTTQRNYGIDYDRLTRIKAEYDPGNLFRLNANIKPAT